MKLGIVGLPNVGKSTLFNSLTQAGAESANYPFCTIDPNVGMVKVPDSRLYGLQKVYGSERVLPAVIEFVDIAGLVEGASKGEGLGNQFLAHIREVDAIVHVVRCFDDVNVVHVGDKIDPIRDIEIINTELLLSDLDSVSRRIERTERSVKGDKSLKPELDLLIKIEKELEDGTIIRNMKFEKDEIDLAHSFNLLTNKPVIYAANVSEDDLADDGNSNDYVKRVREHAKEEGSEVFVVSAKMEEEIAELDEDEKKEFLNDLGLNESGLDKLINASYRLLGLISFLTAGPKEVRAWTVEDGVKAPQAAGKIHTDFERGFIRAEVVNYDELTGLGSYNLAREKGVIRLEGKDYTIKDGDVVLFRFNV